MLSKFAIGTALLGVQAMDLQAGVYERDFVQSADLTNEFMSHAQRLRLAEEWEKTNPLYLSEGPEPLNSTHRRQKTRAHPTVKAAVAQDQLCTYAVNRLKAGPPTVAKVVKDGVAWTDATFTGTDTLYWDVGTTATSKTTYDTKLADTSGNGLVFERWPAVFTTAKLFQDANSPHYTEPNQGGAGTCYLIQALAGVAEFPALITSMFLTKTENAAGIYAIRFFIRGKPWVVAVDNELLWYRGTDANGKRLAYFTKDANNAAFWAPVLEKAWAKVKGNYVQANGGFIIAGVRALTGVPGFWYSAVTLGTEGKMTLAAAHTLLLEAETANYIMNVGTAGSGNDQVTNSCGIAMSHAYSILAAFTMKAADDTAHSMLLMRNPWGSTGYTAGWNHADAAWTDALVAQVPLSVDPRTANAKGIFAVEMSQFGPQTDAAKNCFNDFSISHERGAAGYKNYWYDQNSAEDSDLANYEVTAPAKSGDLYFSVETYPAAVIPTGCFGGSYTWQGTEYTAQTMPTFFFAVYINAAANWLSYTWHSAQFARPLLVAEASYAAGDKFKLRTNAYFVGAATREYTVHVYTSQTLSVLDKVTQKASVVHMDGQSPSGFTDNLFWGIDALCDPKATSGTTCCATVCKPPPPKDDDKKDDDKKDDDKKDDDKKDDGKKDDDKKDEKIEPAPVVPADTPTGKTDDEILEGPPPANASALIDNFNQLLETNPGAAIGYLISNIFVLFKFW